MTDFGIGVFQQCSSLREVYMGDGVVTIEDYRADYDWGTFTMCYNLEHVKLSRNLRRLPINMFGSCENLRTVEMFDKLETITIACEEGIAATSDLKITATDVSTEFTVTQTDSKTLTMTAAKPITTYNNMELNINISAGDIILCPGVMDMSIPVPTKYGVRTLVKYNIVGYAPAATITETSPANGSTVEELASVVFTFSYYVNKTENQEILPRLYNELTNVEIPVEYSTKHEDGVTTMYQAAIKAIEPIRENGNYILEVPEGYFVDANGKDLAACKISFTVKNEDTGIEEIIAKDDNCWTVYNATGVKLFETTDADILNRLPCGLYIINGEKVFVK